MANYPLLPATIPALAATSTDPQGTESAEKIDDCLRQTRQWLVDFLSLYIDPVTGQLKPAGFGPGSIADGSVTGATANAGTQRKIALGSVSDVDLRDLAVITAKVANLAITAAKIADLTITAAKIADATITSSKYAPESVDTSALGPLAVTGGKIAEGTIVAGKYGPSSIGRADIAQNAVEGDRMPQATVGQMLVGGNFVNAVANCLAPKTITGAISIDADGVATIVSALAGGVMYANITENAPLNADAPASGVAVWNQRGVLPTWTKVETLSGVIGINATKITFLVTGVFLVRASSPAYGVGKHKARLKMALDGNSISTISYDEGTSEIAPAGVQSRSLISAVCDVTAVGTGPDAGTPYIILEHYMENTIANGLGKASNASTAPSATGEQYAEIEILQLA